MNTNTNRVREIFVAALKMAPDQWEAYLNGVCGNDSELRSRVQNLLVAHREAGSFLEPAVPGFVAAAKEPVAERPGTVIGPYKLLEQIGEGGFGVVFMAEQQHPVRRKVALKVIKPGMDTRQVVARFEAERQALALMDHPHIAKVLDAGATDTGRPYFVMDLVRGIPITQFCDDNRLTLRERLELFVAVCQAVQHAHQKGIIHRDLKPSNVLVTLQDGTAMVKVIDFGIAKALGQERLTDMTLLTGFAQMIGSPLYMSPEQAEMSGQDADTRTDIYSLGVLLYELLTGTTPFGKERLKEASYDEMRRIIREEEPAKPSTRISTLGQAATTVSANRKSEPRRLSQLFRRELDWIVMKALEKDRNHRYDTANAFAADVQRYLHDEPVQACPPSAAYRFRKFARRNRAALMTAAVVAFTLVLAVVGLAASTFVVIREKARTDAAKDELQQALERERQNSYFQRIALAEREWSANRLERVQELLTQCPEDLRSWEWHYLKRLALNTVPSLRQPVPVLSAVFSPDGRWIATGGLDGAVRIWDAITGQLRFDFPAHTDHVRKVAFSHDGRRFATASWDKTAKIWDFDPRRSGVVLPLIRTLRGEYKVQSVAFSPDNERLALAGDDKNLRIWDVATGRHTDVLPGSSSGIRSVAYSPDGQYLATANYDKTVKILDAGTGWEKLTLPHRADIWSLSFSRDGHRLVSTTGDLYTKANGEINVWDASTGEPVRTLCGHTTRIVDATFSPDGKRLASAGKDGNVKLWDLQTGQEILTLREHRGVVYSVAFSPDGTRLLSAGTDGTARIWDATPLIGETGQECLTLKSNCAVVYSVAFSPDGYWLASVGDDGDIRLWDHQHARLGGTDHPIRTLVGGKGYGRIVFSHNGQLLALGGGVGNHTVLKVWATNTWAVSYALEDIWPLALAFSRDDKYLATCSRSYGTNSTIEVRDTTTGHKTRPPLRGHSWAVLDMAFSPDTDAPRLASAGDDTVRIWDLRTGKEVVAPLRHSSNVLCTAFSYDGRLLASGGLDRVLKIWDARTWESLHARPDPTGAVQSIAFHPTDSHVLAWGSTDGTVKVWNSATEEVRTFHGHTSWVESVAYSPDGQWLASGSLDGTVKLWQAPPLQAGRTGPH
jgi:WD40 repeat protein/serine/threonine protein kinase